MILVHDKHVAAIEEFLTEIVHVGLERDSTYDQKLNGFRAAQCVEVLGRARRGYPNAAGKPKFVSLGS